MRPRGNNITRVSNHINKQMEELGTTFHSVATKLLNVERNNSNNLATKKNNNKIKKIKQMSHRFIFGGGSHIVQFSFEWDKKKYHISQNTLTLLHCLRGGFFFFYSFFFFFFFQSKFLLLPRIRFFVASHVAVIAGPALSTWRNLSEPSRPGLQTLLLIF